MNRAFYEYRWMPRQATSATLFGRRLRDARKRKGMDEGSSSARISRYETGIHEPPYATAVNLAAALKVPVAYFYCDDDRLADFLVRYASLKKSQKEQLLALAVDLSPPTD
jgi:transcriptional regulator with XRE-family HTH domain